jgi:hypothetical protein
LEVKLEGKRVLGRRRRRWEGNIKVDIHKILWEGAHWIDLAEDTEKWWTVVKTVMNIRAP